MQLLKNEISSLSSISYKGNSPITFHIPFCYVELFFLKRSSWINGA